MSDFAVLAILGLASVAGMAGIVALFVWMAVSESRDKRALEQWATQHGWGLMRDTSLPFEEALPERYRGKASYLLHSTIDGWSVAVAKWTWESGNDSDSQTHSATVTAVKLSQSFPEVSIRPHRRRPLIPPLTLWPFKARRNTEPVQLGHAAFDAAYDMEVDKDATDTAHKLLGPRVVAELLAQGPVKWGIVGNDMYRWTGGWPSDPKQLQPNVDGLLRVAKALGT